MNTTVIRTEVDKILRENRLSTNFEILKLNNKTVIKLTSKSTIEVDNKIREIFSEKSLGNVDITYPLNG